MRRGRSKPRTTATTVTIPVSSFSTGAQAANAFPGWISPGTTVFQNSSWGASNTKYLSTLDMRYFLAKTTGISRDQEVSTWGQRSVVYLRLTETGKAIVFIVSPQNSALEVYVANVTEGANLGGIGPAASQISSGFITPIVSISSVPGYSATSNAGHYWTFGCEGFDIYAKYNGVEFWRTKQFWHLEPGRMAIATQENYGFRDVTATHKISVPTYSDIRAKVFDIRDFGMKSVKTTGTIVASSTTLVVYDTTDFSVGDKVCIATGGEPGGGVPGEQGVGGSWPALKYLTVSAMNSDTTQVTDKVCGVLSTGDTYQWNGTAWVAYYYNFAKYLRKILPKAHVATITAIAGDSITIDTPSVAAATDANVYFDNASLLLNSLTHLHSGLSQQGGCTISFPAGDTWVFANTHLAFSNIPGISFVGAGIDVTTILSPTGAAETGITAHACPPAYTSNFTFRGNNRADKGFYFRFDPTTDVFANPTTFVRISNSNGSLTENIKGINYSNAVSEFAFCQDSVQRNIEVIHETGQLQYFQWAVNISDSANCISENIHFDCPWLFKGLESFRSSGSILRNVTGRNVIFSSNSNTNLTIENCQIEYEAGCADSPFNAGQPLGVIYPDPREPLININSNIDNTSGSTTGSGVVISNCDFDVQGRVWTGYGLVVIGIDSTVEAVTVVGKYPDKPVSAPSGLIRLPALGPSDTCLAIRAQTADTDLLVDGVRVITAGTNSPIGALGGNPQANTTIQNCVLDNQNAGGTQTNNMSNAAYEALP